jgi:ubiquinone/menaquinone biosynthesis C-methylase UbiE
MTRTLRHPIFARVFDRTSPQMERELGPRRDELLAGLTGHVVEIGAGNGTSFSHYPAAVDELVAVEPEPYLRRRAIERAASAPVRTRVVEGVAETLPLEDGGADAVVVSIVLCSVLDPGRAVAELRRVLKRGGELRFLEHVRASDPRKARVQKSIDRPRLWPRLAGGCHCGRDTVGAIEGAGLRLVEIRSFDLGPAWLHTNPYVIGRARAT